MKYLFFKLPIIIGFLFFTSCNNNQTPITDGTIEGSWHLKNITGGLIGVDIDYSRGKIVWDFNIKKTPLPLKIIFQLQIQKIFILIYLLAPTIIQLKSNKK